ncbi:WD40 repeat domain-containing protein [Larkinella terrae]|uniref:WD40 repeat domain-containing protein n=1 Tax=Larkinella terrae TaxID=2025311 RepID=A0A7K0EUV5_9BACT|nr:WD40 repeat domain-containing protein [Larkinella terrae]MRS65336.1 hypothetical protein [Larkinella terrae]
MRKLARFLLLLTLFPALAYGQSEAPCKLLQRLLDQAARNERDTNFVLSLKKLYSARVAARKCPNGKPQMVDSLIVNVSTKIDELRKQANEEARKALNQQKFAERQTQAARIANRNATLEKINANRERDNAVIQRNKADSLARLAEASRLATLGSQLREKDPTLALQLLKIACDTSHYGHETAVQQLYSILSTTDPASFYKQKIESGDSSNLSCMRFSKNRHFLASGSYGNTIRIWDWEQKKVIQVLTGRSGAVLSVAFSTDGRYLVSGGANRTIEIWDWQNRQLVKTLHGHAGAVLSVNFSADGNFIVSGSEDKIIRIWRWQSDQEPVKLKSRAAMSVYFSADGKYVISAGDDEAIKVWEWQQEKLLYSLDSHLGTVRWVNVSADERYLISGGDDETIKIWNWKQRQLVATLPGNLGAVLSAEFSPDGRYLVGGGQNGSVKVWDWQQGKVLHELRGHQKAIVYVGFSVKGDQIVSGSCDRTIKIWNWNQERTVKLSTVQQQTLFPLPDTTSRTYLDLRDGEENEVIVLKNRKSGKVTHLLKGHERTVFGLDFSEDGRYAVTGGADKIIRIWDLTTDKTARLLKGHKGAVSVVIFSADGRYVVSGGIDFAIKVWDYKRSDQAVYSLAGSAEPKLQIAKDNSLILTTAADGPQVYRNLVEELNRGTLVSPLSVSDRKEYLINH